MLLRGIGNAPRPGSIPCVRQQTHAGCSHRLHLAPVSAAAKAAPGAPAEPDQAANHPEAVVRRRGRPRKTETTSSDSAPPPAAAASGPTSGDAEAPASRGSSKSAVAAASEGAGVQGADASTQSDTESAGRRRPLFGGASTQTRGSSSSSTGSSSSSSSRDGKGTASEGAKEEELKSFVWSALSSLKTSRSSALLAQQQGGRKPPAMTDLASALRAAAPEPKPQSKARGGRAGKSKEIVLVAPPEEREVKFKPPAPLPPAKDDPRVQESLEKLEAGDFMATKWILVQPPGTKRDLSRRAALGEERVEELMAKYRAMKAVIKIGRSGPTERLRHAIQLQWRTEEVAKLRIHDERSARDANMPRFNLMLRELEVCTGGTVLDATGKAIWLYRGDNYVQPPKILPKQRDFSNNFVQGWKKKGAWHEIGGEQCYVTGEASHPTAILVLPDMFPLAESEVFQACDRIAQLGHLVVMPDLLQPREGTWPLKHYPPLSVWKNRLADWYRKGPGCIDSNREHVKNVLCALSSWGSPPGQQRSALATLGFGWGGNIALRTANAEAMAPAPVKAGAALYPELFGLDHKIAADIGVPVTILPAKHGPMERTMLLLQETKPELARRCLFKRNGKVQRGYATWAPVWEPKAAADGWEFITYAVQFIEHAWEGKVFVPPDEKGYKLDVGAGEEQGEGKEQGHGAVQQQGGGEG